MDSLSGQGFLLKGTAMFLHGNSPHKLQVNCKGESLLINQIGPLCDLEMSKLNDFCVRCGQKVFSQVLCHVIYNLKELTQKNFVCHAGSNVIFKTRSTRWQLSLRRC